MSSFPDTPADIEATLSFVSTTDGGRQSYCSTEATTYRPMCDLGLKWFSDLLFQFVDKGRVYPGETAKARGWFLSPQYQRGRLFEGFEFKVQEGKRLVANGTITKVINPALLKSDT